MGADTRDGCNLVSVKGINSFLGSSLEFNIIMRTLKDLTKCSRASTTVLSKVLTNNRRHWKTRKLSETSPAYPSSTQI